ncbi:hypothetical protein CL176_06810 [Suicoccus acidiformans]|uniref:Aldehyde dehydrogenase domain-containing protein n=1 Tax=Suicoccus acidiformans TaxID=2036206 RepID=A0A347WKX5_9LACT|nr:aldehyde dehydrogenase family protein [Suicoccus acidiformans]AXY25732.1 hypothetical protein CL176_06810 [Suicoccus acidiformans]
MSPITNSDFPKIINEEHYWRLKNLVEHNDVYFGGQSDDTERVIAPTVVLNPPLDEELMQEEIFGPILPVLTYQDLVEAVVYIQSKDKPLALYLFSRDEATKHDIVKYVAFGGGTINDTLIHFTNHNLPFGGVGASGMGQYHGKHSLETFSHPKGIMEKTDAFDIPLRYPPYTSLKERLVGWFM